MQTFNKAIAQVGFPKPLSLMNNVSFSLLIASYKRQATHMGCRVCKAGDLMQRSDVGLHLSDKVVLATNRFVYPVSFHPERKRCKTKKVGGDRNEKKF